MKGKIVKIISNRYEVLTSDGLLFQAIGSGKTKADKNIILGDDVEFFQENDCYIIKKIDDRRNEILRPNVANVDQVLIVMSYKEPDFDFTLVNRLIMHIELSGIKPAIILTKVDIKDDKSKEIVDIYEKMGYRILTNTINDNINSEIISLLENKTSVLAGQSGCGKSSLINQLLPNLNLKTQVISKALNRGKHTTTHNELFRFKNALIADTPGFSSLEFRNIEIEDLLNGLNFFKIDKKCKFSNCIHENEPDCCIKEMVNAQKEKQQFYKDYLEVIKMIRRNKKW